MSDPKQSQTTEPETGDGDRIFRIRISAIRNRALRRACLVALYPVLTVLLVAMLPFAVIRKIILHQIALMQSTVRVWKLP